MGQCAPLTGTRFCPGSSQFLKAVSQVPTFNRQPHPVYSIPENGCLDCLGPEGIRWLEGWRSAGFLAADGSGEA